MLLIGVVDRDATAALFPRTEFLYPMAELTALTQFLTSQLPAGSVGAVRPIRDGDELLLRSSEGVGLERAVLAVRRASGAGRDLARQLCGQMGVRAGEIPRALDRVPVWPGGIVGSITHDGSWAAAVVADAARLGGVGIDIESRRRQSEEVSRRVQGDGVRRDRPLFREGSGVQVGLSARSAVPRLPRRGCRSDVEHRHHPLWAHRSLAGAPRTASSRDRVVVMRTPGGFSCWSDRG
jgi:hypothetical protein